MGHVVRGMERCNVGKDCGCQQSFFTRVDRLSLCLLVRGQFHSRCGMLGRFRPQKQASSVVLCRLAECHALLPAAMVTWYCGVLVLLCAGAWICLWLCMAGS